MAGLFGGIGKMGKGLVRGTFDITEGIVVSAEEAVEKVEDILLGKENVDEADDDDFEKAVEKAAENIDESVLDNINEVVLGKEKVDEESEEEAQKKVDQDDEAEKTLGEWELAKETHEIVHSNEEEQGGGMIIPKHFSLKSIRNHKYLRLINEGHNSDGLLRFSSTKVVSPYSKFEVVASKTHHKLVHIRCSYNNKFWVRFSSDSNYIAALANEQQEDDVSKWSCTLFEPLYDQLNDSYRFRHLQLNAFLYLAESAPHPHCLLATPEDKGDLDLQLSRFTVVDWDSIFILPKYVAFKGHNDKYLKNNLPYLEFSASNAHDSSAAHEIISARDGFVRIKHFESGLYWVHDPSWIMLKSIDTSKDDPNALFQPVKVDNNVVAFRSIGNGLFCKGLTTDGKTNCLNAAEGTITDTTRMQVEEVVVSRSIENIEYRVKDARVHGLHVLSMSKGVAENSTNLADTVTFTFANKKKMETTWKSSVSVALGVATKFTSKAPEVSTVTMALSFETSAEKTWGETHREKTVEEVTHAVTVAPMSKVSISGMITEAKCDVPFSYTQRDTLKTGKQVVRRYEDGLFTGLTSFDFKFETKKLPLH